MMRMKKPKISHWAYHPAVRTGPELTLGEKAADKMRHGLGSWSFVGGFVMLMAVWMCINGSALAWDPYPFILLNLMLSTLAGLQGAVLLIAAKRADAIAAALAKHHLEVSEEMHEILQDMTDMIEEIHEIHLHVERES